MLYCSQGKELYFTTLLGLKEEFLPPCLAMLEFSLYKNLLLFKQISTGTIEIYPFT
jgi:hypothetical protein